ncbi:MAG TPA: family 1 glycosylhydrolase [Acidimicrobiales bacterium]
MAGNSFPDGFRWGTATAAHQIEGGNTNNDWWRWEHTSGSGVAEPSGDACDSWHRWNEDGDIVAGLGLDHYRFSLEWSRIEPARGEWSVAALDHYRRVCDYLRERDVEPIVTFHHFTTPAWLADDGGWEKEGIVDRFAEFCHRSAAALGQSIGRACTLNEPNVVATMGYVMGMFPPGRNDPDAARDVTANMVAAHRTAVEAIRSEAPSVPVGLTLSMTDYQPAEGGEEKTANIRAAHEDVFLQAIAGDDFLGVQTYTRMLIGPNGWVGPEPGVEVLPMGYELWPQALAACLRRAWAVTGGEVPLWVTENGIGTDDDQQRIDFVAAALRGVLDVIDEGVRVDGYTYWSLLDNFEWAFGYRPHFGLVAVDRTTFERRPKPSARWFSEVARNNRLPA